MVSDDREFQKRKEELEERVGRLEAERITLISEVDSLREKRTLLDLEKKAHGLQDTVDMLRKEKDDLEGQISSLESNP